VSVHAELRVQNGEEPEKTEVRVPPSQCCPYLLSCTHIPVDDALSTNPPGCLQDARFIHPELHRYKLEKQVSLCNDLLSDWL
jgi:hypothetical protein